jgi:hypothetical protein
MKVEGWLFLGCGLFSAAPTPCTGTPNDPAGTTALALSVGVAVLTH